MRQEDTTKMFRKKRKIRNYVPTYKRTDKPLPQSRQYRRQLKKQSFRLSRTGKYLRLVLITSLIIFGSYALFFSSYFKLSTINFNDQNLSSPDFLEKISTTLKDQLKQNLLFLDTKTLEKRISDQFSELETVQISKNYPNSITIEFSKFPLVANIINESSSLKKSYIINAAGIAVKEDLKHEGLPTIHIVSDEPLNTAQPLITAETLKYILDSIADFNSRFGEKVQIIEVTYKPIAREVHLLTARNFYIWLDLQRPYDEQFKKLKKALVKLDIYSLDLEYIDLRIAANNGDRIIYKLRK